MKTTWLAAALVAFCLFTTGSAAAQSGETANTPGQTAVSEGDTAPAFTLTGSDGETYSLEDLKGKKNLVLVFFRGTW